MFGITKREEDLQEEVEVEISIFFYSKFLLKFVLISLYDKKRKNRKKVPKIDLN